MKGIVFRSVLALISLIVIGGTLGITAVVISIIAGFCYKNFKRAKQSYEINAIVEDTSKVTGIYHPDVGILQNALSIPLYRDYFLFGVFPIASYAVFLILLFKLSPNAYTITIISDGRLLVLLENLFPTIKSHYLFLVDQSIDKAPLIRQIYSLIFIWASFSALIYLPLISPYIRLCTHILRKQKTITDAYIKPFILVLLLSSLVFLYYYCVFDAPNMGGSKDFIFRQYGHYNIVSNDHFLLYMLPGFMIPPLIVLALIFAVSLYKILSSKEQK